MLINERRYAPTDVFIYDDAIMLTLLEGEKHSALHPIIGDRYNTLSSRTALIQVAITQNYV
jgi:hypothetical protein